MSGGVNKAFLAGMGKADPSVYLRSVLFESEPMALATGRIQVNLQVHQQFIRIGLASLTPSRYSHQFYAFWCGNRERESVSVVLNDTADYFFTPAISGCILEINGQTITHHDGEVPGYPPAHLALVAAAGPLNTAGHRKWETSEDFFCSSVIGKRTGVGTWQFWQQTYTPGASTTPLPAGQVSRI